MSQERKRAEVKALESSHVCIVKAERGFIVTLARDDRLFVFEHGEDAVQFIRVALGLTKE